MTFTTGQVACRRSYAQQYQCLVVSSNGIAFDACLAKELFFLWDKGIKTTGSCCGKHLNGGFSYIGVEEKYIPNMIALGYIAIKNNFDDTRQDSFIPKCQGGLSGGE